MIKFQSAFDEEMPQRTWEYNALASILYRHLTYSVVIYIKPCPVAEPVYERRLPTGELYDHFHYRNIKLWEMQPGDIEQMGLVGLYPLMVLTRQYARSHRAGVDQGRRERREDQERVVVSAAHTGIVRHQ